THTLEHGVSAEAVGELAYALDGLVASLADDVRRAELLRNRDAVGMTAQEDDSLGAEAPGGDHAAQADGTVADDGHGLARPSLGAERGVLAGRHHIRQRQERRHQRVVSADREGDERAVGLWHAHRLALAAVDAVKAVSASMEARRLEPLSAEDARAVGPHEGCDNELPRLHRADVGADRLDDAD